MLRSRSLLQSIPFLSLLLGLVSFTAAGALAQEEVLIEVGDEWRYWKGTEAPPADWAAPTFDDFDWLAGPTGIGYGDVDDATVLDDMEGGYVAFFARRSFEVADPASVSVLTLQIDFDDGFVAHVNGTEVGRQGLGAAGTAVALGQTATAREAGTPIYVNVPLALIESGTNVLAIELHNADLASTDASLIPRLLANAQVPPSALTCAVNAGAVSLAWTNNGTYDSISVERNGVSLATLGGGEAGFTDTQPTTLDNVYSVVASVDGSDLPSQSSCTVACTQGTLTCSLSLTDGATQASLAWSGVDDITSAQVYREGALLATLTAGETSHFDPDVESDMPEDDTDYRVVLTRAGGSVCTLTCGLSLCPTLDVEVVDGQVVLAIGNVVKAWDHFEISRDGVLIEPAVPPEPTSLTDRSIVLVAGNSYDYQLHPVAVPGGELPALAACDALTVLAYVPELGSYDPPEGGWDYVLELTGPGDRQFEPAVGVPGNLDGEWIRSVNRDLWNGRGPDDAPGPAPGGPAPGGIDIVTRPGLGPCGEGDASVLRILDPGNTGAPIGAAFPAAFNPPSNSRILLGLDLGVTDRNVLRSGVTLSTRLRLSPDAPAYMSPQPSSGDGGPIATGMGHVGVYYTATGALPGEGMTAGAAISLNSGGGGGDIQLSTVPGMDLDSVGTLNFVSIWMTVEGGAAPDTYDVKVYFNGSTQPSVEVGGTGVALDAGTADFGAGVINYLAIGSNDTANDAMLEIDHVAYKLGVFEPSITACEGAPSGPFFHRGDADDNGGVQLTDALRILGFLFLGGEEPPCLDAADADDNGGLQLTDALRILGFLFLGGVPPSPPFGAPGPGPYCGTDPTPDELNCLSFGTCP